MNQFRVGQGWDLHRLVSGRQLWLGGQLVPSDLGEDGHSDGDVLLHAITDALLGSLSLGDIGRHYPPSDERWKGAASEIFIRGAAGLLAERDWHIVNVDATIVLERPKLAPHIDSIRNSVASLLDIDVSCVSIKAKTSEGVNAAGERRAIEAQAMVLISRD